MIRVVAFHSLNQKNSKRESALSYALFFTSSATGNYTDGAPELVKHNRYAPKIVQNILGHSRIDVALEVYTKVIEDDIRYAVFDPLAAKVESEEKEVPGNPEQTDAETEA